MSEKGNMRKWELGCIVFNSLICKMFMGYSECFARFGGSAAWLTAAFSGLIFLIVLGIILKIASKTFDEGLLEYTKTHSNKTITAILSVAAIIYFAFGICYIAYSACTALKTISYENSPIAYILLFFVAGAFIPALFGEKAVRRLHSLNTLGIGAALMAISVLSLRYADTFNIYPILGKGTRSVFLNGLSTLFMYSDIILIFFLPKGNASYSFGKTVFVSAILAVIVNVFTVIALSLNMPYELSEMLSLPVYPLTKAANLGKFPMRLDALYQISLISTSLLYISIAFNTIFKASKAFSLKRKHTAYAALCLLLCLPLCGCYDSNEVEEKAYIIALGIDSGMSEKYKYTFQISNPLESGGSIGAEEKADEGSSGEDESNKTVDNIIIEADDFYTAKDKLKSYLSKKADISHIKIIVYSYDTAYNDALAHSQFMLSEREVRPGTNLCLAESAEEFLLSVNPTLEESTVRYYELFFKNQDMPYAPVTELRDFVGRSADSGFDAVIPIVGKNGLYGMGGFSDGILKELLDGNDTFIYKLLCGNLPRSGINGKIIESDGLTDINVDIYNNIPEININLYIKTNDNINSDLTADIKRKSESLLYRISASNCDILGIGRYVKRSCATQNEWENINWDKIYPNSRFYINIFTKNVKDTQNLQNN